MPEPVQIVELWQPRCSLRFGEGDCPATLADGPRCYNCWGTCPVKEAYQGDGSITWRFVKPGQYLPPMYERDGDDVKTDPLPLLAGASARSSKINIGALRDGEKPLGITGRASVQFLDAPFDDWVGDWYLADRASRRGNFWAKFTARNPFFANMRLTIYEGEAGQTLDQMEKRLYLVENIDGPSSDGKVTLSAVDPLWLADDKRAKFPRETEIELYSDIDAVSATVRVIASLTDDMTDAFGNTATSYLTIGSEIISYTGQTDEGDGRYLLTGVARGTLGTTAASHKAEDKCQRCGHYELMDAWDIAYDLITGHTSIPPEFIDKPQWDAEAGVYLQGYQFSRTVPAPQAVNKLLGELMRDGTFYVWWDERAQLIPLKAVRPEVATRTVSDAGDFVAGTIDIERSPDERISRAVVYFGVVDPTKSDDPANFRQKRGRIEADAENEDGGAEIMEKVIYSRWIINDVHAREMLQRLLARFAYTPVYLPVVMVDDAMRIGDVVNVQTRLIIDSEGAERVLRWQVIEAQRVKPAETTRYLLQQFIYQSSRYGVWMADDAPTFDEAPEELRELGGAWWSNDDGEMSDGSAGYLWQ
jgi:hypothetical protein